MLLPRRKPEIDLDIFITTFEAVATLLFIGIVGFYMISRKVLPESAINILAVVTIDIALPALVFVNIVMQFNPHAMPLWWHLPLYFFAFTAFAFVLAKLLSVLMLPKHKAEFTASLFYQNAVFFPLAIISGLNSSRSELMVKLFFFTLFFAPVYFSTVQFFFNDGKYKVDKSKIFNPILLATIAGISVVFCGLSRFVPDFVNESLMMVGKMSTPLLMLIFGGSMYLDYRDKGRIEFVEIVKFIIAKNLIFPAVMIGIIALFRPAYDVAFLLLLQAAVPPITSLSVMAKRYNGRTSMINQFLFSSFMISLLTIPLFMMLFEMIYGRIQ